MLIIPLRSIKTANYFYEILFNQFWFRSFYWYTYLLKGNIWITNNWDFFPGGVANFFPLLVLYFKTLQQLTRISEEEIDTKRGVDITIFESIDLLTRFRPLWWYVLSEGLVLGLYRLRFSTLFTTIHGRPRTQFPILLNTLLQFGLFQSVQLVFYYLASHIFIFPFKIYPVRKFNHYYRVPVAFRSPIQAQRYLLGRFRLTGSLATTSSSYVALLVQELVNFLSGEVERSLLLTYLTKQIDDVADSRSFVHFKFKRTRRRRRRTRRNPVWLHWSKQRHWRLVDRERRLYPDFPFHTTTPFANILKPLKRKRF